MSCCGDILMPMPPNHSRRGFTLIELLVVIAIIGVLSAVVLASLNSARARSRDAVRVASLREVGKALAVYYLDNGTYPSTGGNWYGSNPSCFGGYGNNAAPGLVPAYISQMPLEITLTGCYLYRSNGTDYKYMSYRTMEACAGGSCPLQDPYRPSEKTSAIYTPGGVNW